MAIYTANQSGNLSSASTWDANVDTPTIHATTNITLLTTGINTVSFTAPNLVNAVTGVWVFVVTPPIAGRNLTAQLFDGVSSVATATINQTDLPTTGNQWVYFRLATPYVFLSLTASNYKWLISSTTANSGTVAADNASTTKVASFTTYNVTGSPGTSDACWIGPFNCVGSAITVTVDGIAGDIRGAAGTGQSNVRLVGQGLVLGGSLTDSLAILKFDTAANSALSITGMILIQDGGELQMGTVASPYPSSFTATLTARQGGGGTNTGIVCSTTGKVIAQGAPRTYYATTYVSGTGVAASPLVVSDPVDWVVGDRIAITATSANATNYNETEYKFIITKNSSTSYVLSSSSGGAESAFSFTHTTNAKVLLLTRNVNIIPSVQIQMLFITCAPSAGYINLDWVYLKNLGGQGGTPSITSNSNLYGFIFGFASQFSGLAFNAAYAGIDYCVFDQTQSYGIINGSSVPQTYTGNIFCASQANAIGPTSSQLGICPTAIGHTFTDHYFIGNTRQAIEYRGVNCTFNNCTVVANNSGGTTNNGAVYLANGCPVIFSGGNFHANRVAAIILTGTINSTFTNSEVGTKGINAVDILVLANTSNNILFDNSNFGSATLVSGHTSGAVGSTLVAFNKLNQTANNHKWYTEYGSAQSTGAGLSDTTVRTAGSLNVRMAPENSSNGFYWEYKVLAVPGKAVSALGFIQKNVAFGTDVVKVELFLPGSTVADASQTMGNTTGSYLVYNLAANYAGSVSLYARIRITAKTITSAAYIYLADILNGTNHITDLTTWDKGQPSPIMFEQLGDAAAIWAVLLSTLTTPGTTGYKLASGGGKRF